MREKAGRKQIPGTHNRIFSAIYFPIASEAVAAGEGALST